MSAVIIIILILAILLVIFTLQNSIEISITVFFWKISDAPLVLVLLCCILLGYIIASVYFYPRVWKLKKENRKLNKSNRELQQQSSVAETAVPEEKNPEGIELDVDDEEEDDDDTFFKE